MYHLKFPKAKVSPHKPKILYETLTFSHFSQSRIPVPIPPSPIIIHMNHYKYYWDLANYIFPLKICGVSETGILCTFLLPSHRIKTYVIEGSGVATLISPSVALVVDVYLWGNALWEKCIPVLNWWLCVSLMTISVWIAKRISFHY